MTDAAMIRPLPPKPAPTALARWMRRSGYTAAELSRAVGCTKATISRLANGKYYSELGADLEAKLKKVTGLRSL